MAYVSKRVSDISGQEAPEKDFVTLVVRDGHPATDEPRALDALAVEVDKFKAAEVVLLEVKNGSGEVKQLAVPLKDFRALVDDKVVAGARKTRGRRPGTTNKS